ncbi:hypothetical protein ACGFYQ_23020 [Streptomyces sp. NPDC048258]|uniref:hypothetical protein n=1 Tax=Streptomyces sp. NPDC048258 TaxID=3365527 RepID=UPI0037176D4C
MRKYAIALFFAVSLTLTACSGDGEPKASDSPPPTAAEIAYYDCLKGQGIKIVHLDYGAPRVDKDDPSAKNLPAAQEACKDKVPPEPSPVQADPKVLDAARKETACMRAEGVTWYPDPDPVTAEFDDKGLTVEQRGELRTKHRDALLKCKGKAKGGPDGVLGG